MVIKVKGMVLSQRSYRDSEKYLTILTKDYGLIEARIRVFGQIRRTVFQTVGPPGYYQFDLFTTKNRYTVDAVEPIEDFFDLRYDVEKVALASYLCELTQALIMPKDHADDTLRLLLNTLYLLAKGKRTPLFLKAVYEWRVMAINGFMPNLVCCRSCCEYEKKMMYFLPLDGELVCSDCMPHPLEEIQIQLSRPVLAAMRHIVYAELERLFQFRLSEENLRQLSKITEYYVKVKLEKELKSLALYQKLKTEEL